nr:hypothetical protein [Candidatus Enterovibrio escacola]
MPLLIHPSYRFIKTYAFSDIRFLKILRSEEKERSGALRLQITPYYQ